MCKWIYLNIHSACRARFGLGSVQRIITRSNPLMTPCDCLGEAFGFIEITRCDDVPNAFYPPESCLDCDMIEKHITIINNYIFEHIPGHDVRECERYAYDQLRERKFVGAKGRIWRRSLNDEGEKETRREGLKLRRLGRGRASSRSEENATSRASPRTPRRKYQSSECSCDSNDDLPGFITTT